MINCWFSFCVYFSSFRGVFNVRAISVLSFDQEKEKKKISKKREYNNNILVKWKWKSLSCIHIMLIVFAGWIGLSFSFSVFHHSVSFMIRCSFFLLLLLSLIEFIFGNPIVKSIIFTRHTYTWKKKTHTKIQIIVVVHDTLTLSAHRISICTHSLYYFLRKKTCSICGLKCCQIRNHLSMWSVNFLLLFSSRASQLRLRFFFQRPFFFQDDGCNPWALLEIQLFNKFRTESIWIWQTTTRKYLSNWMTNCTCITSIWCWKPNIHAIFSRQKKHLFQSLHNHLRFNPLRF